MEKRALIAFVLSLVVLIFWDYYFGLFRTPAPPTTQESQTAPQPEGAKPSAQPQTVAPPSLPPAPAGTLPEQRLAALDRQYESWLITDGLYQMKIFSPGARIGSFQLKQYREEVSPDSPSMELLPSQSSGYLPLAVDLLQHQSWQLSTTPFRSSAPAQLNVSADAASPSTAAFTAEIPGEVRLTKLFTFQPGSYVMDVELQLENLAAQPLVDQLGISFYFQPYTGKIDDSNNPSQLSIYQKGETSHYVPKDMAKKDLIFRPPMHWVGYENNYFLQAVVPLEESGFQIIPRVLDADKGLIQLVYLTDPFQLPAQGSRTFKMRLYMGAKELSHLKEAGHSLDEAVDYGWFTFLALPLLYVMRWIYTYVHNYGVAIILITILIKIIFWPLTQKSYQSMQGMKKVQPKIAQIREKYKDDKEKMSQELMGVYRTNKVNPMGGCLPMVLQIPVFFALYRMLNGAIELRHEPFMLWINDLTAPDRLHIGFDIPYLGGLPVMTILMGISMFIQQKMTPSSGDPKQEQIMLLMPVVFTVFFVNFPSGLVLYWLVNNVLSIAQQYWVNRQAA